MRSIIAFVLLVTPISSSAQGYYIESKKAWEQLPETQKALYAVGVVDMLGYWDMDFSNSYDSQTYLDHSILAKDLFACTIALRLKAADLVDIVDTGYNDIAFYDAGAPEVLIHGLRTICLKLFQD